MNDRLPVSEIFGPTIQGEGLYVGQVCSFVRLAGCDFECSWCDTPYARNAGAGEVWLVNDVVDKVREHNVYDVVITGGNPALQDGLADLVLGLSESGHRVHVETQGSVYNPGLVYADVVAISPKPPSSGNMITMGKLRECTAGFINTPDWFLKVVVADQEDLDYAVEVNSTFATRPLVVQVHNPWPSGGAPVEDLLARYRRLVDMVLDGPFIGNVRVLPQQHVLIYGNERGR